MLMLTIEFIKGIDMLNTKYYIRRKLQNGAYEYVCAPKGWRYSTQMGAIREQSFKGGPEMSFDPYKKFHFDSKIYACQQAAMIPGSEIIAC